MKKPISVSLIIISVGMLAASKYINYQVELGEIKVRAAEKKLHSFGSFFSIIPIIPLSKGVTGSAQKQIDAAEKKLIAYSKLASELYHISIPIFLVGLSIFVYSFRKPKR